MAFTRPNNKPSARFRRRVPSKCSFCFGQMEPDYKDVKTLKNYMTDKGKIVARSRTGLCQKHQRALSLAIKHARHMALVPFVSVLK